MSDALRSWLRRQEQPVKLKLDGANVVDVPTGRGRWRELLATLGAYKPKVIEALRADGSMIRARPCEPDDFDTGDEEEEQPSGAPTRDLDIDVSTPSGAMAYALVDAMSTIRELAETVRACATDALDRTEAAARTAELHARADLERARREGATSAASVEGEPQQQSDLGAILGAFGVAAKAKANGTNGQG